MRCDFFGERRREVVKLVELSESEGRNIYLKDGDYFGEIAVLTGGRRMMSVRAVTYCHLYSLQQKLLERILQQYPECVNNLVVNMMHTYDNFEEIKEQIFSIAGREQEEADMAAQRMSRVSGRGSFSSLASGQL